LSVQSSARAPKEGFNGRNGRSRRTNRVPDYLLSVRTTRKASVCALVEMVARHFDCCAHQISIQLKPLFLHAKSIHIIENWIAQSSKCSALLAPPFETPQRSAERKKIRVEKDPSRNGAHSQNRLAGALPLLAAGSCVVL